MYDFNKDVVCTDSLVCSDKIVAGLEFKTGFKLHARTPTDSGVEGSVSIHHKQNDHEIHIELYKENQGRLKEVLNIPSTDNMNNLLIEVLREESRKANPVLDFIRRLIPRRLTP